MKCACLGTWQTYGSWSVGCAKGSSWVTKLEMSAGIGLWRALCIMVKILDSLLRSMSLAVSGEMYVLECSLSLLWEGRIGRSIVQLGCYLFPSFISFIPRSIFHVLNAIFTGLYWRWKRFIHIWANISLGVRRGEVMGTLSGWLENSRCSGANWWRGEWQISTSFP